MNELNNTQNKDTEVKDSDDWKLMVMLNNHKDLNWAKYPRCWKLFNKVYLDCTFSEDVREAFLGYIGYRDPETVQRFMDRLPEKQFGSFCLREDFQELAKEVSAAAYAEAQEQEDPEDIEEDDYTEDGTVVVHNIDGEYLCTLPEFNYVNMRGQNLSRADLYNKTITGVDLSTARLVASNMGDTIIRMTNMTNADMSGVRAYGAVMEYSVARDAKFVNADLKGAKLHNMDLRGADFRGADLRGADLRNVDLSGANLTGADMRYVKLSNVDMRTTRFSGLNLRGAEMENVQHLFPQYE